MTDIEVLRDKIASAIGRTSTSEECYDAACDILEIPEIKEAIEWRANLLKRPRDGQFG